MSGQNNILLSYGEAAAASNGLLTGLVSYWKFDETSGTTAFDAHGSNDGTITGATVNATGIISKAYSFDGSGDFVNAGNLTMPSAMSWSAWIKLTDKTSVRQIVGKGNGSGSGESFRFRIVNTTGYFQSIAWYGTGTQYNIITGSADLADDVWHLVGMTFNGSTHTIYVDGSQVAQATGLGGSVRNPADNVYFGKLGHPSIFDYFKGTMDEIGHWSRILDGTDYSNLYNGGAGLAYSNFTS